MTAPYVIAIDGGGSKTDAVAIALDGTILARTQGAGSSPHLIGREVSAGLMNELVGELGMPQPPTHASIYLSGLDLPHEITDYRAALGGFPWAAAGLTVDNDLFALLRAGTAVPDAAAVVCGTGINAIGIRADGATARFVALGPISGDWGGATGLGEQALWHAARDADGRGPATSLTAAIAPVFGLATVAQLTESLHLGTIALSELARLSPLVFEHARAGDVICIELVERQADEIAIMAATALRRLGLDDRPVPVVLGGGVIRARDERLLSRVTAGLVARVPHAVPVVVDAPPLLGAALLALESAGATAAALEAARVGLP